MTQIGWIWHYEFNSVYLSNTHLIDMLLISRVLFFEEIFAFIVNKSYLNYLTFTEISES